jgi:hypothetical protein
MTPMAKRLILSIYLCILLLLAAFPLSEAGLFPWSGLNCWTSEIDVYSGQRRYTRYLYWIPTQTSIYDTAITKELTPENLKGLPTKWYLVNTGSPQIHHSPHYRYHGAWEQIRDLEDLWKRTGATKESRRFTAIQILRLWQTGSTNEVRLLLNKMYEKL